jgi:predicted DNA-binding transcriptional regulator
MNSVNILADFISATLALYRVTELLPKEEPLRLKMRELNNSILENLFFTNKKEAQRQIDLLLVYFSLALNQNWVKEKNFLVLKRQYQKIREKLDSLEEAKQPKQPVKKGQKTLHNSLNSKKSRQQEILEMIKENQGKIDLEQLREEFTNISTRTLRRDMNSLVDKGLVKRVRKGKKDIDYILKNNADK